MTALFFERNSYSGRTRLTSDSTGDSNMNRPRKALALAAGMIFALTTAAAAEYAPVTPPPPELARHIGVYQMEGKSALFVAWLPEAQSLIFVEHPAGRIGPLVPAGAARFTIGPTLMTHTPIEVTVGFDGDDVAWSASAPAAGGPPGAPRRGRRLRLRQEEAGFDHDGIHLAGTITLPAAGKASFPAIVLIHGGGPQTRDFAWVPAF